MQTAETNVSFCTPKAQSTQRKTSIRSYLFRNGPEKFKAYSLRAAQYFLQSDDDPQNKVEGIYHLLVAGEELRQTVFWNQMEDYCSRSFNLSAANMLLANLLELMSAGILAGNEVERLLGVGYAMLGDLQRNRGSVSAAEDSYRKAMPNFERLAQADPANAEAQRDLSISYTNLGDLARQRGDLSAAQQAYQQALEIRERLAQADPANAQAQRDLSVSYNKLGRIEEMLHYADTAIQYQEQARSSVEPLLAKDPENVWVRNALAEYQGVLERLKGDQAFNSGNVQAALELYQQALTLSQQVLSEQPDNLDARRDTYWNSYKIGQACAALGQHEQAQEAYQSALQLLEPLAENPLDILAQRDLALIREAAETQQT